MNELRQDPVTGRQVIVATHRDARPNQFVEPGSSIARRFRVSNSRARSATARWIPRPS